MQAAAFRGGPNMLPKYFSKRNSSGFVFFLVFEEQRIVWTPYI